jgi:hypothetical protein
MTIYILDFTKLTQCEIIFKRETNEVNVRSKRHVNEASKHMTIEQLRRIQENSYRSECLNYDYNPSSIDYMLNDKLSKQWQVENDRLINEYNEVNNG